MRSRSLVLAVLVAGLLVVGAGCSSTDESATDTDTAAEAVTNRSITLLDPGEFEAYMVANPDVPVVNTHIPYEGHIAGTDSFVAFDEIAVWDGLPTDLDAPIVLYCRSGNMSADASATLVGLGYTNIVDLAGGMNAWTAAGKPLLTEKPPAST